MGKSYVVTSYRGLIRCQAWPKPRGPAKTTDERNRQTVFRILQGLAKRLHPRELDPERVAIAEHNRTHRGQRGSAAIRHRDWVTQRLYGRACAFTTDQGIIFYPPAIHRDASHILDHVSATPGALIARSATDWSAPSPGSVGDLLSAGPSGAGPVWQTQP